MARRSWIWAALALGLQFGLPSAAVATRTDGTVVSFDATPIAYTLFTPDAGGPAPAILVGHGFGLNRDATSGVREPLVDAGYAVLTWDARGHGASGGQVNLDSQEYEVRDVRALIDFLAGQPAIQLDGPGDPRLGMAGASYGGAIQTMTAATDGRVDVIAPAFSWNDLSQSFKPNGVLKFGATQLLFAIGLASTGARLAPEVDRWAAESTAQTDWSPETQGWVDARSPRRYISGMRAPTLVIQGTPDIVFPLNEGIANAQAIEANGVATKMIFTCDGHTADPPCRPDTTRRTARAMVAWFDRHLRGDGSVDTGAPIDYQTQDGSWHSAAALPKETVSANGSGRLVGAGAPSSGEFAAPSASADGFRFKLPVESGSTILGIPTATATLTGQGSEADIFFKLLDVEARSGRMTVIDNQVMPVRVRGLSSSPKSVQVDLGGVAWKLERGHDVALEVASSSNIHAASRSPFTADVRVAVSVPLAGEGSGGIAGQLGTCRHVRGLRSVRLQRARGGRLRVRVSRSLKRRFRGTVVRVARGRAIRSRRAVVLPRLRRSFMLRPNPPARRSSRDVYVLKVSMRLPGGGRDVVQLAFAGTRNRLRPLPGFRIRPRCKTLEFASLHGPAFGGQRSRSLGIAYRLRRPARVRVTIRRGRRVVRRLGGDVRAAGVMHRLRLDARGLPRGDYRVHVAAHAAGRTSALVLGARRL